MFGHSDYKRSAERAKAAEEAAKKEKESNSTASIDEQHAASDQTESEIRMGHRYGNYWN